MLLHQVTLYPKSSHSNVACTHQTFKLYDRTNIMACRLITGTVPDFAYCLVFKVRAHTAGITLSAIFEKSDGVPSLGLLSSDPK